MIIKFLLILLLIPSILIAQGKISGVVTENKIGLPYATIVLLPIKKITVADAAGNFVFENVANGAYTVTASMNSYITQKKQVQIENNEAQIVDFDLLKNQRDQTLDEIVISGTLKAVKRLDSPVPVEIYSAGFIKKNPTPTFFEALQNINGIRPQVNCGICNTGDIRINGLEGAYTFVLIDGMPIVSALASVYGLSGIPNALIERIEIVKGPASSLYGSEAVGGLVNIITKNPVNAAIFSADYFTTSWLENNLDLGFKVKVSPKTTALVGVNYFRYQNRIDNDNDNFTDVALQNRLSVFNKWNFERKNNRAFSLAARGLYEDRWGGDMRWQKKNRGGSEVYGESIYTKRAEFFGNYQLPTNEKLVFAFSANAHFQDSKYGNTDYVANQKIGFGQLTWDKKLGNNDFLLGIATRYTYYDDNTTVTGNASVNLPNKVWLPGIFAQNEIVLNQKNRLLIGVRYDYNSVHGNIFTPRVAYKLKINDSNSIRINAGTGYRVVNVFSEDHTSVSGSRMVELKNNLKPEQSANININYTKDIHFDNGMFIDWDTSVFYTKFSSKIFADYETDGNKIIYNNLSDGSVSQGISTNVDINLNNGLRLNIGATAMDVQNTDNDVTLRPFFTERISGAWSISYTIPQSKFSIDYTGNFTGSMRLPLLNANDPRSPNSPNFSIQNIQFTYKGFKGFELYGGVKNLLNFTPLQNNPYLIARANDPFDQNVQFDANNSPLVTAENPFGATFDTLYVYAQNQGIRGFFGLRYTLR